MLIVGGALGALGAVTTRRIGRKYRELGKVECAIRSPESLNSARSKWRHGLASVEPGSIHFRPAGPAGLRIPRGDPITIPVEHVSGPGEIDRRTSFKQAWSIRPGLHIITLTGQGLTTELAARPEGLDLIRRDVI